MSEGDGTRRIAIACQGGGSHTAFTAGVLERLLTQKPEKHEIAALSGTSGGAVCALLAWYGLLENAEHGPSRAADLLRAFWRENSARALWDKAFNDWLVGVNRLQSFVALPALSPYDTPFSSWGHDQFESLLKNHVDFEKIESRWRENPSPMLLIGAVDVVSGEFKAFNSRRENISVEMVLASAALPTMFRAVHIGGHAYWDGLFSQNPPVRELCGEKPDEIWVIQIDPQERKAEPKSMVDILDRRNELAGNLSLHQELHAIETMNEMVEELGAGEDPEQRRLRLDRKGKEYKIIRVRRIEMSEPLDVSSKLDRSPALIRHLMDYGREQADEFLRAIPFEAA